MSSIFLNKQLQNDDVFVISSVKSMAELTQHPCRQGLEKAIISNGEIVNVVSKGYGHLPNERFFMEVEEKLMEADVKYVTRSINRDNRSFAVDYLLSDDRYHIDMKGNDTIVPMLRFVNSYDGSCKTFGNWGFFRRICSNGLHVSETKIGFSMKHRGEIVEIVLPEISGLIAKFMDNEYYTLRRKFDVLAECPISNLKEFVKYVLSETRLFQYEASEKNPEPSLNARTIIDTINRESTLLNSKPTLWLGYNAFNELLHGKLKKSFEQQRSLDGLLFDTILQMA